MSEIPNDLYYSRSHEWLRTENDETCVVGITDHAQSQLGDLVFVDLPQTPLEVHAGDEVAVIESVKTAADIYAPVSGEIVEINSELVDNPGRINKDPYGEGWLFRIRLSSQDEIHKLLDAKRYQAEIEE